MNRKHLSMSHSNAQNLISIAQHHQSDTINSDDVKVNQSAIET